MTRYVTLLRGVNVGGVTIKSAELAEVFRGLGYENVKTVLASGNVLFDAPAKAATLKPRIEKALNERFHYEAWVHVLPLEELARIVAAFPFDAEREGWQPYVVVVMGEESAARLLALADDLDPELEAVAAGDGVIYWTVERGHTLDSGFGKILSAARYKSTTTSRNLRTLNKLLAP